MLRNPLRDYFHSHRDKVVWVAGEGIIKVRFNFVRSVLM